MANTPLTDPEYERRLPSDGADRSNMNDAPTNAAASNDGQRDTDHIPDQHHVDESHAAAVTESATSHDDTNVDTDRETNVEAHVDDDPFASALPADLILGRQIGTIRLEERLGAGAMASIYRGYDVESGTQLAVKILHNSADAVLQERFRMEARTVRALDHPHVVKIVSSGQSEHGLTYIAMELVEGEDLGTLLERRHQLSVLDACRVLSPIVDALAHAHATGIIHRDVKPSNILLRRVPVGTPGSVQLQSMEYAVVPLLSDFGIARALDAPELTTAGRTIGTPAYMSPEQCAGNRQLDGRADIYSLGTVLYRTLVGRPPFVGSTTQILHAHVYEPLTVPDTVATTVPPTILAILQKALQKEPSDRYGTAAEMAADLALLLNGYPGLTAEQSAASRSESTATMPSLPTATTTAATTALHVLVPGARDGGTNANRPTHPVLAAAAGVAGTTQTKTQTKTAEHTFQRRRQGIGTWLAVVLGIGLTGSVALLLFWFASTLGPRLLQIMPGPDATRDAALVINAPTAAATASIDPFATTESELTGPPIMGEPVLSVTTTTTAAVTTTVIVTDVDTVAQRGGVQSAEGLNVAATWGDVLHYYQSGDWGQTRWNLMTMLSADDGIPTILAENLNPIEQARQIREQLFDRPDADYWLKWGDVAEVEEVERMLVDAYVGLAMQPERRNTAPTAVAYLQAAAIASDDQALSSLRSVTARFLDAPTDELWQRQLQDTYLNYAAEVVTTHGAYCLAADVVGALEDYIETAVVGTTPDGNNANSDNTNSDIATLTALYQTQCGDVRVVLQENTTTASFNGTIYYSTEFEDTYGIVRVELDEGEVSGAPTLIVQDAAQPSISDDRLAFYSRRNDSQGLSGLNLSSAFAPDGRFSRYTGAVEDARESPARWNPVAEQFVFSSKDFGDGKPRIYTSPAVFTADNSSKVELGLGEDPVWSPDGQQILFRDNGVTGNTPGLFIMSASGQGRSLLTNGEDRRPIWTADGRYIVFMRRLDADNWELFRRDQATGEEVRLTTDAAKDGLPALSPDGQTIVFATDRSTTWELWTVPLAGGDAEFLMPIEGTLYQWLEHAIQWVN